VYLVTLATVQHNLITDTFIHVAAASAHCPF